MDTKIIGIFVGIAVSMIVLGSVLAPVINDVVAESDTFINEGYYTLDYNVDKTIEWNQSAPYDLVVNGSVYDLKQLAGYGKNFSVIATTDLFVRATITDTYVRFASYSGQKGFWETNSTNTGDFARWTIDDGVISVTYSSNSTAGEVEYAQNEKIYSLNATGNGTHVMKKSSDSAYINSDSSVVILAGITRVGESADVGIFADGTYDDLNFTVFNAPTVNPVISNVSPTFENAQNHKNLILLEKYNFNITITGDIVKEATYDYFVVPVEVSALRTDPIDRGAAGIFVAIIPLMIVALLMMAVTFIRSRY